MEPGTDPLMHLYAVPKGVHAIPDELLDLRPDCKVDKILLDPAPVTSEKNIWFFWHKGYAGLHPYTRRNVLAYHRRFSKLGWTIRVMDRVAGSPTNIANFLDINDPDTFPEAFRNGTIGGDYALQHTSDLVRWPLLLRYGGIYADVGMITNGDLDRLWNETVGNDESPYEVLSYLTTGPKVASLCNYFLGSRKGNPLFSRCHKLFLALWAQDGGKVSTEGMWASPLLKGVPMIGQDLTWEEDGQTVPKEEGSKLLTDYIIQGQVLSMVMYLVDKDDGWNGPEYSSRHIYASDYMEQSQLVNVFTDWDGRRAFELLSLPIPRPGEEESKDQAKAREIVEGCLARSFGFKLAHGLILRVFGCTLGSLWRDNPGSDVVPGTYAAWFRHGCMLWSQDHVPPTEKIPVNEPFKHGSLLRVSS